MAGCKLLLLVSPRAGRAPCSLELAKRPVI